MTARLEFIDVFPRIYFNNYQTKRCLFRRKGKKNQQLACCLFSLRPLPTFTTYFHFIAAIRWLEILYFKLSSENEDYGNISHHYLKYKLFWNRLLHGLRYLIIIPFHTNAFSWIIYRTKHKKLDILHWLSK